ncbi:toprim domain-containing protein [Candidatus Woesearchaeota archaeon]|nr:toprim domain-containing protein [Candidatus Woesearchaeota archaeon]MBW3017177.1 toprim domain-containing protein [Candidatus Woesearchaeota archaeon]
MDEDFGELLNQIDRLKNSKKLVVVEGEKDKNALAEFGIKNVYVLKKALYSAVEQIASMAKECVVLTDFDAKGKELYTRIKHMLQKLGVKVDDEFRDFLIENTKLTHIEGLDTYVENLQN